MNKPLIGIVLVNYNGEKYQNECVQSILDSSYKNYRIIIVDNNSTDKSMLLLNKFDDDRIVCIYEDENGGVAKGNNIGIKKSMELGCSYTLLLNNDTVLNRDTIEKLYLGMGEQKVAVPLILFYNTDLIWYGGGEFVRYKCVTKHLYYAKSFKSISYSDFYNYAPTCCMLIDNTIFEQIGYMDENYFLYFDDADFCIRLLKNGIKIKFCRDSILFHKVSLSTGGKVSKISVYYENRNRYYFYNKHKDFFSSISYLYFNTTRYIKYIIGLVKNSNDRLIFKAIQDYKCGNMGRNTEL